MTLTHPIAPQCDEALMRKIKEAIAYLETINFPINGYKDNQLATVYVLCKALADVFGLRFAEGRFNTEPHCWLVSNDANILDVFASWIYGGTLIANIQMRQTTMLYKEIRVCNFNGHYTGAIQSVTKALNNFKNSHP